jgi:hypothetical protein
VHNRNWLLRFLFPIPVPILMETVNKNPPKRALNKKPAEAASKQETRRSGLGEDASRTI